MTRMETIINFLVPRSLRGDAYHPVVFYGRTTVMYPVTVAPTRHRATMVRHYSDAARFISEVSSYARSRHGVRDWPYEQ